MADTADTITATTQELKSYTARCHCKSLTVIITSIPEVKSLCSCNCTLCTDRGIMGFMVDPSVIKYEATPESAEGIYEWGQKRATHIFCKNCGSLLMTKLKKLESMGPVGGKVNINARCIEGMDLKSMEVTEFDGKNLL